VLAVAHRDDEVRSGEDHHLEQDDPDEAQAAG